MKEEFTNLMFEEFAIPSQYEICAKVFCIWDSLDWEASKEEITKQAKLYGLTYEQAMRWKKYWMKYIKKSPK